MRLIQTMLLTGLIAVAFHSSQAQKTKVQSAGKICEGLEPSQKPMLAIMPFKISVPGAAQAVGNGLSDMLMDAVFNSGCFRVVDRDRMNEVITEGGLGLSGVVDEKSAPQLGKIKGAQVLVFGTVTKFAENVSGASGGLAGLAHRFGGPLGGALANGRATTSLLGYTLKFVDASTAEVLDSKSFDEKVTSIGLAAAAADYGATSAGAGGGSFFQHKSMQDAIGKSLIEAVEYMSQNKSAYASIINNSNDNNNDGKTKVAASNNARPAECPLLKSSRPLSITIIIPEEHVAGVGGAYDPYRNRVDITINSSRNGLGEYISTVPCQAAETEISSKLTEAGFRLKDAAQLQNLKKEDAFQNAYQNPDDASKLGAYLGVDMIIVGDAMSEYSKKTDGLVSCRATISVKAVMQSDGSIIAAKSFKGAGLDATELMAGKAALENAATKIAEYLQSQFCTNSSEIIAMLGQKKNAGSDGTQRSNVVRSNNERSNGAGEGNPAAPARKFDIVIAAGIEYEQAKSMGDRLEKTPGIYSIKPSPYNYGQITYNVSTSLSPDDIIQTVKRTEQGLQFKVVSASNESVTMTAAPVSRR